MLWKTLLLQERNNSINMLPEKWDKVLNLVKSTGEHCVIFDQNSEEAFVLMRLEEYENLAKTSDRVQGLTEDELLDRINQDIALWQAGNQLNLDENVTEPEKPRRIKVEDTDEEDRYYIEPVE